MHVYTISGIVWHGFCRENSMTNLSKYIKEQRKLYQLTQEQLAERSGVGLHFVRDMEQGKSTLRMDKVNQVLSLFGAELGPVQSERSEL